MKKRDKFWVSRIIGFLLIILVFSVISLCNILQFNYSYMQEEYEELQVFKRQIEWAIKPFLEQQNFEMLQKYCDDFIGEDVSFRIFDRNNTLIASSDIQNKSQILGNDSKFIYRKYNLIKMYLDSTQDRKIGIVEPVLAGGEKFFLELTVSQADVMRSIRHAQRRTMVFISICILLFVVGLIQIFHSLSSTFNKLEDSVIEVANGKLDTEIEIPQLDLLKELALSIKKMTQRLKTQITRLTQLEQYKTNFLQSITHEIKTPITAINSAIELVETRNSIPEEDRECFDIIQFQIKSIDKLVNDILYLSEIEVEKTNEDKKFKNFNLNTMVKRVITYFSFTDTIINFKDMENLYIYGSEELLASALSNLITNALKYSGSDSIDVILTKKDDSVELIVKDYGIGIEQVHLNHLFEKFYRVDKTRSRKLGGTGLGLAIVKNIVELHGGQIRVESEIGKGTSFTINL